MSIRVRYCHRLRDACLQGIQERETYYIKFYITLYYTISCYIMLYYIMLYYIMLCYVLLYCIILYYNI